MNEQKTNTSGEMQQTAPCHPATDVYQDSSASTNTAETPFDDWFARQDYGYREQLQNCWNEAVASVSARVYQLEQERDRLQKLWDLDRTAARVFQRERDELREQAKGASAQTTTVPDESSLQHESELIRMLRLRKELDPDAPDAIVLPESVSPESESSIQLEAIQPDDLSGRIDDQDQTQGR